MILSIVFSVNLTLSCFNLSKNPLFLISIAKFFANCILVKIEIKILSLCHPERSRRTKEITHIKVYGSSPLTMTTTKIGKASRIILMRPEYYGSIRQLPEWTCTHLYCSGRTLFYLSWVLIAGRNILSFLLSFLLLNREIGILDPQSS